VTEAHACVTKRSDVARINKYITNTLIRYMARCTLY